MKSKTIITIALLVFVLGSVAFLIAGESRQKSNTSESTNTSESNRSDSKRNEEAKSDLPASSKKVRAEETSSQSSHKVIA